MHFSDEAPDSKTGLIMGVEKSMLLFSETEESSGIKPIVNRLLSGRGGQSNIGSNLLRGSGYL